MINFADYFGDLWEARGGLNETLDPSYNKREIENEELARKTLSEIESLQLPPEEATRLALGRLSQQGVLTPEMEQAITLGPSAMKNIKGDPGALAAQRGALEQMTARANDPRGLDAAGRLAMGQAAQQIAAQERGARGAIQQGARNRGMGNLGLVMSGVNQQGAAQRNALAGLAAAAQGEERRGAASRDVANLAGQLRSQGFTEEAAQAQAEDAISRYNAANRQGVQQRNVGSKNYAQERNLGEKQRISDTNVGYGNQEAFHRADQPWVRLRAGQALAGQKGAARTGMARFNTERNADNVRQAQAAGRYGGTMVGTPIDAFLEGVTSLGGGGGGLLSGILGGGKKQKVSPPPIVRAPVAEKVGNEDSYWEW